MFQRHRCCAFDGPGLPNDSAGYPGLVHGLRGTTPSVLRFLSVIRHEYPRYNHAFSKKAQHLQRWIPLWMLTRGRLVPRQPRAIRRTTRTELRDENIRGDRCIYWNIGIKSTLLRGYTHTKLRIHSLEYWYILLFIYSYVSINCFIKWTFQHHRCCAFDSPGLPNDSAGYPGLAHGLCGTTP